jgi:hypothetical protein
MSAIKTGEHQGGGATAPSGARERGPEQQQIKDAFQRVTTWLLSAKVLKPAKSGAGVANWMHPDGVYDGLYPEICGYYLQFLAQTEPAVPGTRDAAEKVLAWLDEVGPHGDPPTLDHVNPADSDWRNKCLFAFDLGMIYRGFAAVEARWPGILRPELMNRYRASLQMLSPGGRLISHHLRNGATEQDIPVKWSTTVDVHHVKIAATLAGVGPQFNDTVAATVAEQAKLLEREGSKRLRDLHPFHYFIEGWLMLWAQSGNPAHLDRAATAFEIVLGEFEANDGTLPPIAGRREMAPRADVLAQALRVGLVLERAGKLDAAPHSRWSKARSKLETLVLASVTPEGGIEFDRVGRHRNIWASLFAWQALQFADQARTGLLDAKAAAGSLI